MHEDDDLLELEELRDDGWAPPADPLVCRCHQVTESEIERALATGGGLEAVARLTGATTGCSGCLRTVRILAGLDLAAKAR